MSPELQVDSLLLSHQGSQGTDPVSEICCMELACAAVGTGHSSEKSTGWAVWWAGQSSQTWVGVLATDGMSSTRKSQVCFSGLSNDGIRPTQIIEDNLPCSKLADCGLQSHLQNVFAATHRLVFE